jgi:hypothetical protein
MLRQQIGASGVLICVGLIRRALKDKAENPKRFFRGGVIKTGNSRIILNSSKSSILAQAINIGAKGVK